MSDKRFPPSIQRLRKARRDGKVVKSRLVNTSAAWIALFGLFLLTRPWVRIGTLIHWLEFKVLAPGDSFTEALLVAQGIILVCVGSVALATVLSSLFQTKGLLAIKQVLPDLTRLAPTGYVKRLRESIVDAAMAMVRVLFFVLCSTPIFLGYVASSGVLFRAPEEWVIPGIGTFLMNVMMLGVGVMVVLGVCAYCLVRFRFMKQHRMSFEEVKQEHKESEGDPHFRAARRHEHQALAMADIEKRVRNSKVLVVRRRPTGAS